MKDERNVCVHFNFCLLQWIATLLHYCNLRWMMRKEKKRTKSFLKSKIASKAKRDARAQRNSNKLKTKNRGSQLGMFFPITKLCSSHVLIVLISSFGTFKIFTHHG
jgi:hypothetical protein